MGEGKVIGVVAVVSDFCCSICEDVLDPAYGVALDALGRQAGEDGVALGCLEGFFQVYESGVCLVGSEWLGAVYPGGEFEN